MALFRDISRGEDAWSDQEFDYRRRYFRCPRTSQADDVPSEGDAMTGETAPMGYTVHPGGVSVVPAKDSVNCSVVVVYSKPRAGSW